MQLVHCHECGAALPEHEEGVLVFCSLCGAAQVQLSEELREQAEEQACEEQKLSDAGPIASPAGEVDWNIALGIAVLGAVAVAVLCAFLPPLIGLAWLLPAVVLSIYRIRVPQARVNAGFGIRVGMLCGVLSSGAFAVVATLQALLLRFVAHRMDSFDTQYSALLEQARQRAIGQYGPEMATGFNTLAVPEFRVGMLLLLGAMMAAVLLVLSAAFGALAGWARGQARARRL